MCSRHDPGAHGDLFPIPPCSVERGDGVSRSTGETSFELRGGNSAVMLTIQPETASLLTGQVRVVLSYKGYNQALPIEFARATLAQ